MLRAYLKKRKLRRYTKLLSLELKQTVGYRKHYTQAQVDDALHKHHFVKKGALSGSYDNCYAYAMYCSPQEFERIHAHGLCETCHYRDMRMEIAETVFENNQDFTTSTLTSYASPSSSYSSSYSSSSSIGRGDSFWAGSDSDGGGFDGGGGGGD